MTFDTNFWRALADYALTFPTLLSLGGGAATWLTEYNRVRQTAFGSVLITGHNFESGGASGQRQFPQELLLDALHCRRHQLDAAYALPAHLADFDAALAAAGDIGRRHVLRFS